MAYSHPNLHRASASANSDAPTMWTYSTSDTIATVVAAGYFNDAAADLSVNDVIYVVSGVGGTPAYGFVVVNSNDGTTVDVTDVTAIGTADAT